MTRLRRDPEGKPILHDSGQAVRVEDAAGNASWAPLANLPADLGNEEAAELVAVRVATLPPLPQCPASDVQGTCDVLPCDSRDTPLLAPEVPVSAPSPTLAPAADRPHVISDESLRVLQEAGVALPVGSRLPDPVPAMPTPAAPPPAPIATAPVAIAAPPAPRPGRRTQPTPADTPELAQARTYRLLAEERAAAMAANLRFAEMANAHVAATRAANEHREAAKIHVAKRNEGTTPGQLWSLGCASYLIGGILGWAVGCACNASGAQLVGMMTLGQILLPIYMLQRRQAHAHRQQRRLQFLAAQTAREEANTEEADHVATH